MIHSFITDYTWYIALIHFFAALILFFIVNWIGARSKSYGYSQISVFETEETKTSPAFNFLFKVLSPVVFYVLFVVLVQNLGYKDLVKYGYFITVFYWLIRTVFKFFLGRKQLTHWFLHFIYSFFSIGLSIWIYCLVEQVDTLLPSPRSLLDQIWILIIIFIYNVLNKLEPSNDGDAKRREKYINSKYNKLTSKYGSIIMENCANEYIEAVTYSIMMYEDFNRHILARWIEYVCFFFTNKICFFLPTKNYTLGIMQIRTNKYITNEQSIIKAIEIIKKVALRYKQEVDKNESEQTYLDAVYEIAGDYNCGNYDYQVAVQEIFTSIEKNYERIIDDYNNIDKRSKTYKHNVKRARNYNRPNNK